MATIMYAPTDKLTVMAMLPYAHKLMGHVIQDGTQFDELTNGLGDIELQAFYAVYNGTGMRHRYCSTPGLGSPQAQSPRPWAECRSNILCNRVPERCPQSLVSPTWVSPDPGVGPRNSSRRSAPARTVAGIG